VEVLAAGAKFELAAEVDVLVVGGGVLDRFEQGLDGAESGGLEIEAAGFRQLFEIVGVVPTSSMRTWSPLSSISKSCWKDWSP
jgi:hypothetical protein